MTKLVQAYVTSALRSAAEVAVEPFLSGPGDVWTVPLTPKIGMFSGTITHYGLNAPMDDSSDLFGNLALLAASLPGGGYQVKDPDSYSCETDWHGWLSTQGFEVYQVPQAESEPE